jgi:hypothetical protein
LAGIGQPGEDGQVNVKLHPVKPADPQREHRPSVLERAELADPAEDGQMSGPTITGER